MFLSSSQITFEEEKKKKAVLFVTRAAVRSDFVTEVDARDSYEIKHAIVSMIMDKTY